MSSPFLAQISEFFYGLCWSRNTTVCQVESASLIFFTLAMIVFGLLGIIFARASLGQLRLEGTPVRILGAVLLVGAACGFIPRYGVLVEIGLALGLVVIGLLMAEKPLQHGPLPAETHTYKSGPDEPGLPPAPAFIDGRFRDPGRQCRHGAALERHSGRICLPHDKRNLPRRSVEPGFKTLPHQPGGGAEGLQGVPGPRARPSSTPRTWIRPLFWTLNGSPPIPPN